MKVAYLIEPPFNDLDDGGHVSGCDVELVRHVLNDLGITEITFVQTEFADLLPGLARGDWQMTTGLFATRARQQIALFSRPIWALPDGLLIRSKTAAQIHGYSSLASNPALTLAVVRDQAQHQSARDLGVAAAQIRVFETYQEAAFAVQMAKVSAYASVARAHDGYLQQRGAKGLTCITVPKAEKPPAAGCFGFAKSGVDLRNRVDCVLNGFIGSAPHRQLMRGFGFTDADLDDLS